MARLRSLIVVLGDQRGLEAAAFHAPEAEIDLASGRVAARLEG